MNYMAPQRSKNSTKFEWATRLEFFTDEPPKVALLAPEAFVVARAVGRAVLCRQVGEDLPAYALRLGLTDQAKWGDVHSRLAEKRSEKTWVL